MGGKEFPEQKVGGGAKIMSDVRRKKGFPELYLIGRKEEGTGESGRERGEGESYDVDEKKERRRTKLCFGEEREWQRSELLRLRLGAQGKNAAEGVAVGSEREGGTRLRHLYTEGKHPLQERKRSLNDFIYTRWIWTPRRGGGIRRLPGKKKKER